MCYVDVLFYLFTLLLTVGTEIARIYNLDKHTGAHTQTHIHAV